MKPRSKSVWMSPGRFGCLGALVDGPGARFLRAGGEEGDEAEKLVTGLDHASEAGFVQAEVGQKGVALFSRKGRDLRLDGG